MTRTHTAAARNLVAAALTGLLIAGTAFFALQPGAILQPLLQQAQGTPVYDLKI